MTTRRRLLAGVFGGAAATGAAALVPRGLLRDADAKAFLKVDFAGLPDGADWSAAGARWSSRFPARVDVANGRGRIRVPAPLASAADAQAVSVFLLDHDSSEPVQELEFSIGALHTRPGVIIGASDLESYLAVTVERGALVLSRFERTRRVVLHRASSHKLRPGHVYTLDVRCGRGRVRARLGKDGVLPASFALDTRAAVPAGMPGVLVIAEPPMRRTVLEVRRYVLRGPRGAPTPIRATYLLAGTPTTDAGGTSVEVRVGCEREAQVVIQWADDPGFQNALDETGPATVTPPAYTTGTTIAVGSGVWWRAVLTDLVSDAHGTTDVQHIAPAGLEGPLVIGAASCAQLWNAKGYHALTRFLDEAAPVRPAMLVYQGDFGYPSNVVNSCLRARPDFYLDRITRFLRSPAFVDLRRRIPVGFTMDDHEYGPRNNCDRTNLKPWTIDLWNTLHADPSDLGYFDWRFGDVQCLTLDGRRYCDPVTERESVSKTKLGAAQKGWLRQILDTSDAQIFVIFSADTFASRGNKRPQVDCWWYGWTTEYAELMTLFHDVQLAGKRIVIMSGDAHGQRIHYHPDPSGRKGTATVIEFICSGLRARTWSMEHDPDPTVDPRRRVEGRSGMGMIVVDPASAPTRRVTLRSINGDTGPLDLFPPLRVAFAPPIGSAGGHIPGPPTHHPPASANDHLE